MMRPQVHKVRVLVGPTSLPEVLRLDWANAEVRHLVRGSSHGADGRLISYDRTSIRRSLAGAAIDQPLADLIVHLNGDVNCLLLAEREREGFWDGAFLSSVALSNCVRFAWRLLEDFEPDLLLFHNHPHELFTYVLLKVALRRRTATYLVHFSALPWRSSISRYDEHGAAHKLNLQATASEVELASIDQYMRRLQASHEQAIPFADRALVSAQAQPFSVSDELKALCRGEVVKNVVRIARKRALYRAFRESVSDSFAKPYVAFPLHYQPEETTMPRGGVFAQQLNAILLLRSVLPERIAIVVKENKATFRAPLVLAMTVRSREFYAALRSVPNTWLAPLEQDTFDLIDHSLGVATITGSVGLEALCRGKKVVVFGDANYESFAGVTRLESSNHAAGLEAIIAALPHDPSATRRDLRGELLRSIGPPAEDNATNSSSQRAATVEAFEYIGANLERFLRPVEGASLLALS